MIALVILCVALTGYGADAIRVGTGRHNGTHKDSQMHMVWEYVPSTNTSMQEDPSLGGWQQVWEYVGPAQVQGVAGRSHSQVKQDLLVASLLGCKRNGYFVDLAANAPIALSNSLMLERDLGWNGLCIEPNPEYIDGLAKRKCEVVVAAVASPTNSKVTFTFDGVYGGVVGGGMNNTQAKANVLTRELYTVALGDVLTRFSAPAVIDYLSLDVEGAESIVMKGFPWNKFRFSVITVERPKPDLKAMFTQHGYTFLRSNSNFGDETWVDGPLLAQPSTAQHKNYKVPPGSCMMRYGRPIVNL